MKGIQKALRAAYQQTRDGFLSLSGSPRDLYLIFAVKVLESYNYFSLSRAMTLYLTEEFGINDYRAGALYGLWGTLLTAYGFVLGGAIDFLGVKLSLIISFLLNIVSRFIMASTTSAWLLLVMLLGPNTVAGALGVPVMTIGVKNCTQPGNRGFAFSLFYSLMNLAALCQGMLMDVFRIRFKHGFNLPSWGHHALLNSGFRMFLASGCLTSLAGLCITFMLSDSPSVTDPPIRRRLGEALHQRGEDMDGSEEVQRPISPELPLLTDASAGSNSSAGEERSPKRVLSIEEALVAKDAAPATAAWGAEGLGSMVAHRKAAHATRDASGDNIDIGTTPCKSKPRSKVATALESIQAVLASRGFWKYMCMCLFMVNLKSIFRHLDATLPKMQLRAFGCDAPIGLVYSINPAMIVLLVPVVGAMTTEYQHFDMIHLGGYFSALSPFWMVLFNTEWATAAFVAMLSLGEAVWSPRWYDYSMSVAPHGREGVFTALASAPLFFAMLPTGMISGKLLETYCPDNGQCGEAQREGLGGRRLLAALSGGLAGGSDGIHARGLGDGPPVGECDGRMLWLIVGCITLSSPILILLTQRWIRPNPQDFTQVGLLPTHRAGTEGEHFDVNEADPTALVENVYQARNESREGGAFGPQLHGKEKTPLLTIQGKHADNCTEEDSGAS